MMSQLPRRDHDSGFLLLSGELCSEGSVTWTGLCEDFPAGLATLPVRSAAFSNEDGLNLRFKLSLAMTLFKFMGQAR